MSLEQRLKELEARVAELEARPDVDTLQPNYITVAPDGSIDAQFAGIFAGSVILPQAPGGSFNQGSVLLWTADGTLTGSQREWIQGYDNGPRHVLFIASRPDSGDQASITAITESHGPAGSAQLQLLCLDSAGTGASGTLLDSAENSMFLQVGNNLSELTPQAPAAGGTYTDAGTTVVHAGGTFTGNVGSTAYTINQIVTILKARKLLPQ